MVPFLLVALLSILVLADGSARIAAGALFLVCFLILFGNVLVLVVSLIIPWQLPDSKLIYFLSFLFIIS